MTLTSEKKGFLPSKWEVTGLIWVAYFLNQADRQIFNVLLDDIQSGIGLEKGQMGLIGMAFNLCYAILVPLGGIIGDRYSRKWILSLCILFWSIATMFTGLAVGFISLIILRSIATGGGEALFGPNYNTMLTEYHSKTRSTAMSIVQTAYYIGMITSGFIAAKIADAWSWEYAFLIFGGIGVIHAFVMIFRLRDNRDVKADRLAKANTNFVKDFIECIITIFRTPTAATVTIGFAGLIFVLTGYLTWMPTYLRGLPFEMSRDDAGLHSMLYTHLAAFFGVLIAGKLSDYVGAKGKPAWRTAMQGLGLIVAAPCIYYMGNSTSLAVVFITLGLFGFARAFFDANTYVVLYDVIPKRFHSTASSVMIMLGFGIGSLGAYVPGAICDAKILEVKPLEISVTAPSTTEISEPSKMATIVKTEVTPEDAEYKLVKKFQYLQKKYQELKSDEEKIEWIDMYQKNNKDSVEVFSTLGFIRNKEKEGKENLLAVNDINSANRVFITNADNSLQHIIDVKKAESEGLSKSFTIFAIIWAVCGVLLCIGGKLFYKKDILKLQQNEK